MKKIKYLTVLLVLFATRVFASNVSVTAEVSSRQIDLGGGAQLTISVNGTQKADPVEIRIDGLEVRYNGASQQMSFINGVSHSSVVFNYSIFPLRTGDLVIPAVTIEADGKSYMTEPINLKVVDTGTSAPQPGEANKTVNLEDKIFMIVDVPKKTFYTHEPIPVDVVLYVKGVPMRDIQMPQITGTENFDLGEFAQPEQSQRVIEGERFDILAFRTLVYPLKTGELDLGPVVIGANIITQAQGGGPSDMDPFSRFFGDDFFSGMFQRVERHPITITSKPVVLRVEDVPEQGRPLGFSGAVGSFDMDVTVSPTDVKAGDPITVSMVLKGQGDLERAKLPRLNETPEMKVYEPQVKQDGGARIAEQVVIPQTEKLTAVPEISFSYFDADTGKYHTITKGPFPVTVKPPDKGEDLKVVGPAGKQVFFPTPAEAVGEDIVFIKEDMGKFNVIGSSIFSSWTFYFVLLAVIGGWIAAVLLWKVRYRMATDESFAGKMHAPRSARKGLAQAREFADAQRKQEFYDTIFKALQQYVAHKYRIAPGSFGLESIRQRVPKMSAETLQMLSSIFQECEIVRYAAASITKEQMQRTCQNLEKVIDHLERIG